MNTRCISILSCSFLLMCSLPIQGKALTDSLKKEKKYVVRAMTRVHSMGQFWYGGRIVTNNPTLDVNFTYDRKQWGLQVFKASDLRDHNTDINFMLAVANKNFHIGKRLTITPNVGFLFEQAHSIADDGTDVVFILNTSYKLSNHLTIDHSALFGNFVLVPSEKDWVNRFRILYSYKHWDVTGWFWHNNKVFDNAEYVSSTLSIFYSRIKVTDHLLINVGVAGTIMPYTLNEESYARRNGVLFTVATIIH